MCNHLMMQDTTHFVSASKATALLVFNCYPSIFLSHATTGQNLPSFLSQKCSIQVVLFAIEQELLL